MSAGIYLMKNMVNGKVYVGSTKNLAKRERQHFNSLKSNKHKNPHLQASFNKYGMENFKYYIIAYCPENNLIQREKFYVNYYKSIDRAKGYNIEEPEKNALSNETKIKIARAVSRAMKGVPKSEAHKKKLSNCLKGSKSPCFGVPRTETVKNKISKSINDQEGLFYKNVVGVPKSEEHKIKISMSLTGKKRAKFTASHLNNMSKATKEWWKNKKNSAT